ncbi:MAG: SPFH domain-containing protein [Planctomycetota bacterium]|nr:SPFH domain-containing protein [Planctomycetota bacterium]
MSDFHLPPEMSPTPPPPDAPRRAGSVTLRTDRNTDDPNAMLDPANQSLADALRIMLLLLKGAMLVLAGLYVISGLQSVKEGERGIRLLFGRIESASLEPGFAFTAPFPLGELVKVDQGFRELVIDKDFWPYYQDGQDPSPDKMAATASLKPGQGGSVLTADGNIAHTKWRVGYRRNGADQYAKNILSMEEEDRLVKAAVKRGIVHACARVTIDELLTQSADQIGSVRAHAKRVAQETLDSVQSGIVIEQLDPTMTIPPLYVRADFARVQAAVSNARKNVENAEGEGDQTLLGISGRAGPYLVERIRAYEDAAARRGAAEQAGDAGKVAAADGEMNAILATIEGLLLGEAVEVPGGTIEVSGRPRDLAPGTVEGLSGGEVARLLADAAAYRSGIVNRTQSDLRRYQAKLEQFRVNPSVMLQRELADARLAFLARPTVQQFMMPPGTTTMSLLLNNDPDVMREITRAANDEKRRRTDEERMRLLREQQFKTELGLTETPG